MELPGNNRGKQFFKGHDGSRGTGLNQRGEPSIEIEQTA
jgi:hypothetical protein